MKNPSADEKDHAFGSACCEEAALLGRSFFFPSRAMLRKAGGFRRNRRIPHKGSEKNPHGKRGGLQLKLLDLNAETGFSSSQSLLGEEGISISLVGKNPVFAIISIYFNL